MKIAVFGLGYVGLPLAVLLARHHEVVAVDISGPRVAAVRAGQSPIRDDDIDAALAAGGLDVSAITVSQAAIAGARFVIVATPTNYDVETNSFDTSSVDAVVRLVIAANPEAIVVIKSTIPMSLVERLRAVLGTDRMLFSPEFLREGRALHDNLHPSRIIVGERSERARVFANERARVFANLLLEGAIAKDVPVLLTDPSEAIKLFANTYLAMRVAFFNELDSG